MLFRSPPRNGSDAQLEFLVQAETVSGKEKEDGTMDFHQRSIMPKVKEGQQVARIEPATPGKAGSTVTGKSIPPKAGETIPFSAGDNIIRDEDGVTFKSEIDGVAFREGDTLHVLNVVEVKGDLNYRTGDLMLEESGALIRGVVHSTFTIHAKGAIVVEDTIEEIGRAHV